jgi:hypothetical protein
MLVASPDMIAGRLFTRVTSRYIGAREGHTMICPNCATDSDFSAWLDGVTFASFLKKWITSACPACGASYQFRLHRDAAEIGVMDGAPGPAFIPYKRQSVPGLWYGWSQRTLQVRHGGRNWKFPTQQALKPRRRRG